MGVRFPSQQQRPDFTQMQQAADAQRPIAQQEEAQTIAGAAQNRAQEADENTTVHEVQEPRELQPQSPAERAADDAGAQTPGSIIDMLA